MEILRPSTPIPHAKVRAKYDYFRNRRYPSDSCLPHLQPLLEEHRTKKSRTTGDLCQPFQRCSVTCDEGETVEILTLSSKHANILKLKENGLHKAKFRLPDISTESGNDIDGGSERLQRKLRHQNKRPQSGLKITNTHEDFDQRTRLNSASSLPCLEFENSTKKVETLKHTANNLTLKKHIDQENKNFDPVLNRRVIFQKYFEG